MRTFVLICAWFGSMLAVIPALAANNGGKEENDSIPFFRGAAVSVDLAGVALMYLSDYGQYEAALRINLKDKYFPIFELGYGIGKHDEDAVTGISTEAKAMYGRAGCDFNIKKDKHDGYRLYAGFRYAYTHFNFQMDNKTLTDPVYGGGAPCSVSDVPLNYHWLEGVFGTDVKLYGPIRLGWSVRYRRRLAHSSNPYGKAWYVPGYGTDDTTHWNGTFNLTFEI